MLVYSAVNYFFRQRVLYEMLVLNGITQHLVHWADIGFWDLHVTVL